MGKIAQAQKSTYWKLDCIEWLQNDLDRAAYHDITLTVEEATTACEFVDSEKSADAVIECASDATNSLGSSLNGAQAANICRGIFNHQQAQNRLAESPQPTTTVPASTVEPYGFCFTTVLNAIYGYKEVETAHEFCSALSDPYNGALCFTKVLDSIYAVNEVEIAANQCKEAYPKVPCLNSLDLPAVPATQPAAAPISPTTGGH